MRQRFARFPILRWLGCLGAAIALTACAARRDPPRAPFVPLSELERTYGRLITAGNHPTPDQHGTGDRLGIFLGEGGTVWGLPLAIAEGGAVLGCAPPSVRDAAVTDTYPAESTIIGATNQPTGWRGGTGKLELLLRAPNGDIRWRAIAGGRIETGPVCWAQESPGPQQLLLYYRLAPRAGEN
jgi:hypothetical protein